MDSNQTIVHTPLFELYATRDVFGPTRHFETPAMGFSLRINLAICIDLQNVWERVVHALDGNRLFNQVQAPTSISAYQAEDIGRIFGEFVHLLQRATDAVVHHFAVVLGQADTEIYVLVEKEDAETAAYAGELATHILNACVATAWPDEFRLDKELEAFLDYAAPRVLGPNSRLIMHAARKRGLPVLDIDQPPFVATRTDFTIRHGLLQVGMGIQQHRFLDSMPEDAAVSAITRLYQRDTLMHTLLRHGIPVPVQDLEFLNKNRFSRIARAAQRIGFPVVLKGPNSGAFHDISLGSTALGPIYDIEQLSRAFECGFGSTHAAWMESYVPGQTYRFLIIDSEVVSIVSRYAPSVVGDGQRSVRELVAEQTRVAASFREQQAWRGMFGNRSNVTCYLQLVGLSWDFVPAADITVRLGIDGSLYNGGWCEEVLECVPHVYRDLALRVARCCALNLAGIDIVIKDMDSDAGYPNCAVIGVKPEPDLLMHARPRIGQQRDPADMMLNRYFPTKQDAYIPVIAITGTNGKTTTSRMIAHMLHASGKTTGLACSDGVYLNGETMLKGDLAGITGSLPLYAERQVEALVLEAARGGLIRLGRSFNTCDVGLCLNVDADHLGQDGIHSVDAMAEVKRQIIENTTGTAILNADDPRCVAMTEYFYGRDVTLFSGVPGSTTIKKHVACGGKAVFVEESDEAENIILFNGTEKQLVIAVNDIPATIEGKARHNICNSTAAIAAAYAIGLSFSEIATSMRQFRMGFETTPNRLNEISGLPYRIILDAAHNIHGIDALTQYLDREHVPGKRILVFSASARFTEPYIREMAQLVSGRFDYFFCKKYRLIERHSTCEEPWQILHDELIRNNVSTDSISVMLDPKEAVAEAINMARPGDLILVLVPGGNSLNSGIWEEMLRLTGVTIDHG